MKSIIYLLLLLCFLGFYSSCKNDLKFNGKSQETFEQSLKSIKENLTGIESDKLGEAIGILIKYKTTAQNDDAKWLQLRELIDNKTVDQVFDMAEQIAKENNFAWMRNSAPNKEFSLPNTIDTIAIEDPNKPDFNQIKNAFQFKIQAVIYKNDSLNLNDLYIFPALLDENNQTISFSKLPLQALITIKSGGQIVHTFNADFTDSYMGEVPKKRGIKLPLKYINSEKLIDNMIDVECKVNTPNGYFSANKKNISINLSSISSNTGIDEQINKELIKETTKTFIRKLGNSDLLGAYNLTRNPKWTSFESFSDEGTGFGGISHSELINSNITEISKKKASISIDYTLKRNSQNLQLKQVFTLENIDNVWYITSTKNE